MTQEEKARAYDEALERAMVLRQEAIDKGYALDYIKDYETIFPELAESEDERLRKTLVEMIHDTTQLELEVYSLNKSEVLTWLEKQKEQKPAEWSEEDERFVRDAIAAVEAFYSEGCGQEELVNWLKSLRPSWKPSEEQMAMLLAVINDSNNAGAESCQLALRELYEQLKKL